MPDLGLLARARDEFRAGALHQERGEWEAAKSLFDAAWLHGCLSDCREGTELAIEAQKKAIESLEAAGSPQVAGRRRIVKHLRERWRIA